MKIQTSAFIEHISVDGKSVIDEEVPIDLEFSAIDTGGGFKDPILDFSFALDDDLKSVNNSGEQEVSLRLRNPKQDEHLVTFSFRGALAAEMNGRLKEDELSRELIGFVLRLLR